MTVTKSDTAEFVRFTLTEQEAAEAEAVVADAVARYAWAESPEFLRHAAFIGQDLPRRLRAFLTEVRILERPAAWVIGGFPVEEARLCATPGHWARQRDHSPTRREEMWLVLCGSLLGDVFGWATQQDGAVVHDIMPVRGHEQSQLGSGSTELLWWHTEEAFHPLRCDYLGLLCLRNHDRVPTTFAAIGDVDVDERTRRVLAEPRFMIRPDDSHLSEEHLPEPPHGKQGRLLAAARERVRLMNRAPEPVPVLYGDPETPYLAIDPFYMQVPDDPEAREALDTLARGIDNVVREVALAPGETLFIDNFRAVHGRKPFRARYDGSDRWLKRINVTRDLRKSRAHRCSSTSRVIY